MSRADLEMMLDAVQMGEGTRVAYEDFDAVFPGDGGYREAREGVYDFAQGLGFKVDDRPDDGAVWFQRFA